MAADGLGSEFYSLVPLSSRLLKCRLPSFYLFLHSFPTQAAIDRFPTLYLHFSQTCLFLCQLPNSLLPLPNFRLEIKSLPILPLNLSTSATPDWPILKHALTFHHSYSSSSTKDLPHSSSSARRRLAKPASIQLDIPQPRTYPHTRPALSSFDHHKHSIEGCPGKAGTN